MGTIRRSAKDSVRRIERMEWALAETESFRAGAFDREPTLAELLAVFPPELASNMLGVTVDDEDEIDAAVKGLQPKVRKDLRATADLVHKAGQLDKDDVETLASSKGATFSGSDSAFAIVYALVQKLGLEEAERVVIHALKPGQLQHTGAFAEFAAPTLDLSTLDLLGMVNTLEDRLEKEISQNAGEPRLVKVRPEIGNKRLYVGIFFQRSKIDGRDIHRRRGKKKLTTRMFDRGAGNTFFVVKTSSRGSRVVFRNPEAKLTKQLRSHLGQVLWRKTTAISSDPLSVYDLSVFKNPDLELDAAEGYDNIEKVLVSDVQVKTSNGNLVQVKAPGKRQDALEDFRRIAKGAKALVADAEITSVTLKFLPWDDGRRLTAKVTIQPNRLHLDDKDWRLVEDHLKEWGILHD